MTTGKPRGQATLQTVDRALSFLEEVARASEPITVREVSARLGLNITTCYHLMNTLTAREYVSRRADGTLIIASRITMLYGGYRRANSSEQAIRRVVEALSAQSGETGYFSLLVGDSVIIQILVDSPLSVRPGGLYVGVSGREHMRAGGKAVLANVGDDVRTRILDRSLSVIPATRRAHVRAQVVSELEQTRQRGWSLDDESSETGICAVGAPVFDAEKSTYGAIGLVAPVDRFARNRDAIISGVVTAAQEVSELLALSG